VTTGLRTWFDKAGPLAQSLTILAAVIAVLALALLLWRATRAALRGKKAADTLTVVAAAMASSVAATGMWHFFSRTMHLPTWIQAVLFAFMEISVLASALRARANVARDGNAGADGLAVWVLTSASGLMSASEASSVQEALVRLGAPLVAAWLWERSMVPERRAQKVRHGTAETAVRWLFSVKRVAVRLGLATALGADLETEDANRRIDRFVRADNRAQRAGRLTRRHAARRRDRAHARLMEQARMQADPRALYAHLGRQAILDVLARLGGDDAVIDRERARQMRDILADATADQPATARPGAASHAASPAANPLRRNATGDTAGDPATVNVAPPAATLAADLRLPPQPPLGPLPEPEPAPETVAEAATQPRYTPRQDELPLHLPPQPQPQPQPAHAADTANGAAFHIPAARQPAPANGQPVNGHTTPRAPIPRPRSCSSPPRCPNRNPNPNRPTAATATSRNPSTNPNPNRTPPRRPRPHPPTASKTSSSSTGSTAP
jgi:hypothetical protein